MKHGRALRRRYGRSHRASTIVRRGVGIGAAIGAGIGAIVAGANLGATAGAAVGGLIGGEVGDHFVRRERGHSDGGLELMP